MCNTHEGIAVWNYTLDFYDKLVQLVSNNTIIKKLWKIALVVYSIPKCALFCKSLLDFNSIVTLYSTVPVDCVTKFASSSIGTVSNKYELPGI